MKLLKNPSSKITYRVIKDNKQYDKTKIDVLTSTILENIVYKSNCLKYDVYCKSCMLESFHVKLPRKVEVNIIKVVKEL